MARRCIWMLQIPFERFEFTFECLILGSNGPNLHSNTSNPFLMVKLFIGMDRISFERLNLHSNASNLDPNASNPFKCLELEFECFESLLNGSNLSNLFQMVRICIWMLRILFEWFKFASELLESVFNVEICIWMIRISFEGFKFAIECFEFGSSD